MARTKVVLRYNPLEARKPRKSELQQMTTGADGDARFEAHPEIGDFIVIAGNACDVAKTLPRYGKPENRPELDVKLNPVFSSLPASIAIIIRRMPLGECLRGMIDE